MLNNDFNKAFNAMTQLKRVSSTVRGWLAAKYGDDAVEKIISERKLTITDLVLGQKARKDGAMQWRENASRIKVAMPITTN